MGKGAHQREPRSLTLHFQQTAQTVWSRNRSLRYVRAGPTAGLHDDKRQFTGKVVSCCAKSAGPGTAIRTVTGSRDC